MAKPRNTSWDRGGGGDFGFLELGNVFSRFLSFRTDFPGRNLISINMGRPPPLPIPSLRPCLKLLLHNISRNCISKYTLE